MKIIISESAASKAIDKGSRVAVRQGSDYWLATVTRKTADGAAVLYDEGSKGTTSQRSMTHLSDTQRKIAKPLTKADIEAIKEKMKAAAAKEKARADKAASKVVAPVKATRSKVVARSPIKAARVVKAAPKPVEKVATPVKAARVVKAAPKPVEKVATPVKAARVRTTKADPIENVKPELSTEEKLSDLRAHLAQIARDEHEDYRRAPLTKERKDWYSQKRQSIKKQIEDLTTAKAEPASTRRTAPKSGALAPKDIVVAIAHDPIVARRLHTSRGLYFTDTSGPKPKHKSLDVTYQTVDIENISESLKKMRALGLEETPGRLTGKKPSAYVFKNPNTGQYIVLMNTLGATDRRTGEATVKSRGFVLIFDSAPPKEYLDYIESSKE